MLPETQLVKIPKVDNELSDIIKKSEDLDRQRKLELAKQEMHLKELELKREQLRST